MGRNLKYNSDYLRFFAGTTFENADIRNLTEEDISIFIISKIKDLSLKERPAKSLFGYINGVFKSAKINKRIKENPCEYIDIRAFSRFYNREQKLPKDRVFSDKELNLLLKQIKKDHQRNPSFITPYAIELAVYTGMRVGELSGLRWSNVIFDEKILVISESEKYDRIKKCYYISSTKTGKTRFFPLTDKLIVFFKNLKKVQMEYSLLNEFVFSNENGRIHANAITKCIRYKCKQAKIPMKSIHALRRTFNSKMKCSGVSSVVAASLLGHTERVNNENYTYDITGMEYKREIVEKMNIQIG